MVNITVRNIPTEILKKIRILAAKERRSLNSELLITLEAGLCALMEEKSMQEFAEAESGAKKVSSPEVRALLWKNLFGAWVDERSVSQVITEQIRNREGLS